MSNSNQPAEDPRTRFAGERTLLAWVRTGLAMMGFGFVVARFGLFLRELEATVWYDRFVTKTDFDITVDRFGFSSTPGDSLRSYFSSQAAALKGSNNLAGMTDPAIDALIDAIIAADSRPALVPACRALDRVILDRISAYTQLVDVL